MIKFRTVRYKNTLSTGNVFTEIRLDAAPTTLITGKNGSGKSTIIEAITYALFGKPYRKVTLPEMVNTINNKNMLVELEFDIGSKSYKIVRGQKPKVFQIFENGVEKTAESEAKFDQKYIEDVVLQMNYKTFVQICILGNATYTPFMQIDTAARRQFVDDMLDTGIYVVMNDVLKKTVSDTKQRIKDLEAELSVTSHKIDVQKSYIQTLHDDRERKVEETRTKIAESQKQIEESSSLIEKLQGKRELLQMKIEDEDALEVKMEKLKPLRFKLADNKKRLLDEIEFFSEHDTCPTCKQGLEQTFRDLSIDDRKYKMEELETGLVKLEDQIAKLSEKLTTISDTNKKIAALDREIASAQSEINSEQQYITKLQKDIDKETSNSANLEVEQDKLKALASNAIDTKTKILAENEERLYQDACSMMLKDTGIKAKEIKRYVPIINKLINKYLDKLDFFALFSFDENFDETIRSRNRDELSYLAYSEGEKFKIDMAIMFTWLTISRLKNTVSTNLLFLDEVQDKSLDQESSGLIAEILKELSRDTHVFVISHHPELYFDKFDRHLKFAKVNNYSVLTD